MKLYTREELKDARVFFDKRPPRFMTVFILVTIGIVILSAVGAHLIKRPYIVKAQGTVAAEGTSYISAKTHGVVNDIYVDSGDFVEKGDPILSISSGNEGIQASIIETQIEELEETLAIMDKYEEALESNVNTLSNEGKELEYHSKVAYYLDALKQETYDNTQQNNKIKEKTETVDNLRVEKEALQNKLTLVEANMEEQEKIQADYVKNIEEKENRQASLNNEIATIEKELQEKDSEELAEKLREKQEILNQLTEEIAQLQSSSETNTTQSDLLEKQSQYTSEIESVDMEIDSLEQEITQLNEQKARPYSQVEQTKIQLLSELGKKRNQILNQLTELNAKETAAYKQDEIYQLLATESGTVHYLNPLSKGMAIQQNQVISEIVTEEDTFYIDSYIQSQDRSRVQIGQPVKIQVLGVNNYRFGHLEGTLIFIEPGTIQKETPNGVVTLYRAKIQLKTHKLESKSHDMIELVRSMPVESRIVYQEETYLEWLLNLLNLKA